MKIAIVGATGRGGKHLVMGLRSVAQAFILSRKLGELSWQ